MQAGQRVKTSFVKCQRTRINEPPGTSRLYELTGRGSQKGCCEPLLASSCREGTDHSKVRIAKTRWTSQDGPNKRALKIKNPAEAKANLLTSRQSNAATKNSSHRQSQLLASPSQGSGGLSGHRKTLRRSLSLPRHTRCIEIVAFGTAMRLERKLVRAANRRVRTRPKCPPFGCLTTAIDGLD